MDRRFFFRKSERLHGEKAIQRLFTESSRSIFIYPLRFSWVSGPDSSDEFVKVLFIANRKRFRRAHERNRIKRILREVYRKNRDTLREPLISKEERILLAISYVGEKEIRIAEVERIFHSIAQRFVQEINQERGNLR